MDITEQVTRTQLIKLDLTVVVHMTKWEEIAGRETYVKPVVMVTSEESTDFQYVAKTVKKVGFTCHLESATVYTMDLKCLRVNKNITSVFQL